MFTKRGLSQYIKFIRYLKVLNYAETFINKKLDEYSEEESEEDESSVTVSNIEESAKNSSISIISESKEF